jgi:hypothetical protein
MIAKKIQGVTLVYITNENSNDILDYLEWSDYMLQKLYHPSDELEALYPVQIRTYLKQLELCLTVNVASNRTFSPSENNQLNYLINTSRDIAADFRNPGCIIIGLSQVTTALFFKHLPRNILSDLTDTLDRRLPERRAGRKFNPSQFIMFLNAISGLETLDYNVSYAEINLIELPVTFQFDRLRESIKDMAPWFTQLSPWLTTIAESRKRTSSWLRRYLGVPDKKESQ